MMVRYSLAVKSDTVKTVDGMASWIELVSTQYNAKVVEFNLIFEPWKLHESIRCDVHIYGNLRSFLQILMDYHKITSVRLGW